MKTLSSSTAQDVLSKFLYADCRYLLLSVSSHLRLGPILYSESTVSLIHKKNKNYELYFTKMTVTTVQLQWSVNFLFKKLNLSLSINFMILTEQFIFLQIVSPQLLEPSLGASRAPQDWVSFLWGGGGNPVHLLNWKKGGTESGEITLDWAGSEFLSALLIQSLASKVSPEKAVTSILTSSTSLHKLIKIYIGKNCGTVKRV